MCCGGLARPFAQPLLCGVVLYVFFFFFFFLQDQSSRSCGHETQISSLSHFSTVILPITPSPLPPLTPTATPPHSPSKPAFHQLWDSWMERRKGEVTTMGTVLVCAQSLFLVFVHSGLFVLLSVRMFACFPRDGVVIWLSRGLGCITIRLVNLTLWKGLLPPLWAGGQ